MNPGQPPSAEAVRQQIGGDPEPIPGQLTLPGMPSPAEVVGGQATLPGLEFHTADGRAADDRAADDRATDDRATGDGDLAAVAAELRALDGDGSRMAATIRDALDICSTASTPGATAGTSCTRRRIWFTIVNLQAGHGPSGMGHTMARSAHQRRADTLREGADAGWACPAPGSLTALRAAWSRRGEPKPSYNCTLKLPGFSGWPLGDRRPTAC